MHPLFVPVRVALCVTALACVPAVTLAEDWSLEAQVKSTSIWSGFGAGTMVHHRGSTEMQVQGRPDAVRKSTAETRLTLVEATEAEFVVKVEVRVDGRWVAKERREPRVARSDADDPRVERDGEESVVIEGKSYPCKKLRLADVSALVGDPMKRAGASAGDEAKSGIVWEHETLGVLKVEMYARDDEETVTTTLLVTRLNVAHEVGDTELACREMVWSCSALGGKTVRLECASVPGRTVRTTGDVEQDPITMKHVKELVGLTVRPPPAD